MTIARVASLAPWSISDEEFIIGKLGIAVKFMKFNIVIGSATSPASQTDCSEVNDIFGGGTKLGSKQGVQSRMKFTSLISLSSTS